MALSHLSSSYLASVYPLRRAGPSLPPRMSTLPTKAFVPQSSSSHLILSSTVLANNQVFNQNVGQKFPGFVACGKSNECVSSTLVKATTDHFQAETEDKSETVTKKMNLLDVAVRFIRPYIFFGTLLSFLTTTARACLENPHIVSSSNWSLPLRGLIVLSVLYGIDGYISPLNQISDVEIDRINKPDLPLASGEISFRQAWSLVISSAIHSIATAVFLDSKALLPFVLLNLALGTIYSVRPFYTKRSTLGAILTCASMRGYAFSLLHCAAASTTLGLPFQLSPAVAFLTIFSTLFGLCIGVMKDLPDLEGDRKCNVKTLASIIGAEKTSYLGLGFLFLAYAGTAAAAICLPGMFRASVMVPAHALIGCYVAFQAWKLAKENYSKEASKTFYKSLWTLLNVEYLLFPFI